MSTNPCRYCTHETGRSRDCHCKCGKYAEWRQRKDEERERKNQTLMAWRRTDGKARIADRFLYIYKRSYKV